MSKQTDFLTKREFYRPLEHPLETPWSNPKSFVPEQELFNFRSGIWHNPVIPLFLGLIAAALALIAYLVL